MRRWRVIFSALFWIHLGRAFFHSLAGAGPCCRFSPTCSEYAQEAIHQHGFFRGFYLSLRRLLRCHPWGSHGSDAVPEILS